MIREQPLHLFLLLTDREQLYDNLECPWTPWVDVCVLLHLVRRYRPARFLEIGTHRGHTTRILADRFPEMSITTVDPGDQVPSSERPAIQCAEYLPQSQIGELVGGRHNVTILKQPFQEIDFGGEAFEMIFIDGNHFLPHVLDDSLLALRLLASFGVVVWHDYNHIGDVNLALDQLPIRDRIVSLAGTWTAFYDSHL